MGRVRFGRHLLSGKKLEKGALEHARTLLKQKSIPLPSESLESFENKLRRSVCAPSFQNVTVRISSPIVLDTYTIKTSIFLEGDSKQDRYFFDLLEKMRSIFPGYVSVRSLHLKKTHENLAHATISIDAFSLKSQ